MDSQKLDLLKDEAIQSAVCAQLMNDIEEITGISYDSLSEVPRDTLTNLLLSLYASTSFDWDLLNEPGVRDIIKGIDNYGRTETEIT